MISQIYYFLLTLMQTKCIFKHLGCLRLLHSTVYKAISYKAINENIVPEIFNCLIILQDPFKTAN